MYWRGLGLLLALTMAACGGGGGGTTAGGQSTPPPTAALAILDMAPMQATAGSRVALTGSALDRVRSANLNNVALMIVNRQAARLELEVPEQARSGIIELVDDDGVRYRSPRVLIVTAPLPTLTSLAPTRLLWGAVLRIRGHGLATAAHVVFAGDVSAPAKALGDTDIEVVVPDGARSGPPAVVMADGSRLSAPSALEVIEPIRVDAQAVYRGVSTQGTIGIAGSGLAGVNSVTIGGVVAAIVARGEALLTVALPPAVNCGAIVLHADNQPAAPAGQLMGGEGCWLRIALVEFAQVLSQAAGDPYQRLVPGRSTWVRALVVAQEPALGAPTVRLRASAAGEALGSLTLSGPAVLPQLASGVQVPEALRYESQQSFAVALPAEWVRPGLQVALEVDAEARYGAPVTSVQQPSVGEATTIDVVLVPLVSGVHAPQMPSASEARDEIERRLPVARPNLRLSLREPYTLSSVVDGVDHVAEFSAALRELEQLRRDEAPGRVYYGLVKPMQLAAGTEGLGYVNTLGMASPSLSALGLDASRSRWPSILVHELGHLFGRPHAPCGIAGDPDFPYLNGVLGPTGLFDGQLAQIVSPVGQSDVMGYCGGQWFSDYNYRLIQSFLEALAPSVSTAQRSPAVGDVVVIAGVIRPDGVQLAPLRARRGQARTPGRGAYRLSIDSASGTIEVPFDASGVDHANDERHFFVTIADPGPIVRLQVWQGAQLLSQHALGGAGGSGSGNAAGRR